MTHSNLQLGMRPQAPLVWRAGRFELRFGRPLVMGIVNATPDSFFDGGRSERATLALAEQLVRDGADLLDVGGESTRPGANQPTEAEEMRRVLPVVRLAVTLGVPVSVDTSRAGVIRAVIEAGADVINDTRALQEPGALQALAEAPNVGVCLMHMLGSPGAMQDSPHYDNVVQSVRDFLFQRFNIAVHAGVASERIALDPGYGFGKTPSHNLALLRGQRSLLSLSRPLLVGWSRKSTLGVVTGRAVTGRLSGSVAAALASVVGGANMVRVHDVSATVDALRVWEAASQGAWPLEENDRPTHRTP